MICPHCHGRLMTGEERELRCLNCGRTPFATIQTATEQQLKFEVKRRRQPSRNGMIL